MPILLPGTEVTARGLRWELVYTQELGAQVRHRLRAIRMARVRLLRSDGVGLGKTIQAGPCRCIYQFKKRLPGND